ncbi:MFS transporter [Alicyclobacillus fastidiosus]|uniref:MFS transporter n=1 Tax=Alicyclobacillus fastidiosus TaxID=392011 RepID=A0ABY6ZGT6_9BACL|nr:MFS transporter [Alicyclobacillus fastidiosus]WAH42077.1 MFS transporter [Alicyclobacillus fastidiosus]GMA63841.1 MFS transporter [Alicyclobacillus fastidiosus]
MDHNRMNYVLIFIDPSLFTIAMTFLSINAVITYFLSGLGATTFEIGLANALVSIGAVVSQPMFVNKVLNLPYKLKAFTRLLYTQRFFLLAFIFSIPVLAKHHAHAMVDLFLVCWGVFNFFVGSYSTFYMTLFAKMISEQQRGRLRGFSIAIGNLLALGASYVTGLFLRKIAFPYNYTIIFAIGAVFLLLDATAFAFMKEIPDQVSEVKLNYIQYFRRIPAALRENAKFKQIVLGSSFMVISQVSLAYYALYAIRSYHARAEDIALFTAMTGIVNIVGNIVFGLLGDRYGHSAVLILSAVFGGVAGFLVIGLHYLWVVYVAFSLTNLCLSGYSLSNGLLMIESVPRERLPMCISINTVVTLIVSSVCTIAGSIFIEHVSFTAMFAVTGVAGGIAWVVYHRFRLVHPSSPPSITNVQ